MIFIKQYGRTILYGISAAFVMLAVFGVRQGGNTGMIQIAYGTAAKEMSEKKEISYRDADAVKAVLARKKPKISYIGKKILPDTPVNLNELFLANDADGNRISVEITDVRSENGESIFCQSAQGFLFPKPGIYKISVKAVDKEKRTVCGEYAIPVSCS